MKLAVCYRNGDWEYLAKPDDTSLLTRGKLLVATGAKPSSQFRILKTQKSTWDGKSKDPYICVCVYDVYMNIYTHK